MPTITGQAIISKVQIVLQDTTGIRWPDTTELLGWLNDAQREVSLMRPDTSIVTANFSCVSGTRQTLPAAASALVDIPRNASGNAIRKVPREILDAQRPAWHLESSGAAKHYTYDLRTPREFYVYPPASGGEQITIRYQAAAAALNSLSDTISVDDSYANALIDYVLWRAYSKDAEYTANQERATASRAAFERTMALKTASDTQAAPTDNVNKITLR